MPVQGTPVPVASGGGATQTVDVTRLYEVPQPAKRRSLVVQQGAAQTLYLPLTDRAGDPVDLTDYLGAPYTAGVAIRETTTFDPAMAVLEVAAVESPAADGIVSLALPESIANNPGIYLVEVVITDDTRYPRAVSAGETVTEMTAYSSTVYRITTLDGSSVTRHYDYPAGVSPLVGVGSVTTLKQQLVRNISGVFFSSLYLIVERGLHGVAEIDTYQGSPTLAEIRLHLRDYPEGNLLLDEYEFDAAEVALCAQSCVDYFNEIQPPLAVRYSTKNFPSRYHWREGIIYQLFSIAAHWYRRNRFPYQAGGVQVDDTGREENYLKAMQIYERSWKEWVMREKLRRSMEEAVGSVGSDYAIWRRG